MHNYGPRRNLPGDGVDEGMTNSRRDLAHLIEHEYSSQITKGGVNEGVHSAAEVGKVGLLWV